MALLLRAAGAAAAATRAAACWWSCRLLRVRRSPAHIARALPPPLAPARPAGALSISTGAQPISKGREVGGRGRGYGPFWVRLCARVCVCVSEGPAMRVAKRSYEVLRMRSGWRSCVRVGARGVVWGRARRGGGGGGVAVPRPPSTACTPSAIEVPSSDPPHNQTTISGGTAHPPAARPSVSTHCGARLIPGDEAARARARSSGVRPLLPPNPRPRSVSQ